MSKVFIAFGYALFLAGMVTKDAVVVSAGAFVVLNEKIERIK